MSQLVKNACRFNQGTRKSGVYAIACDQPAFLSGTYLLQIRILFSKFKLHQAYDHAFSLNSWCNTDEFDVTWKYLQDLNEMKFGQYIACAV